MDCDQAWEEYCQDSLGFAVNCKCGGPAGFCECAKKQWIAEYQMNAGKPFDVSLATICQECNRYTFNPITHGPKSVLLCYDCVNDYGKT